MIIKPELVKKIKDYFNLNIYETKVWLALLGKGVASAGEIAELSGVPRSRTYDVLESLEKQGFAISKLGKPAKYIAVKPFDVIVRFKKNLQNKTDERILNIDNVKDTKAYSELDLLYKQGIQNVDASSLTGSIKGRGNIYNQFESMLKDAKKSVILMTSEDGFVRKSDILKSYSRKLKNVLVTGGSGFI